MFIACDKTLHTSFIFDLMTLFSKMLFWAMTFESEELNVVAIYIW